MMYNVNNYKASVIIPVFNDADDLKRALTELGNQTISNDLFEVIVVDNGSTDHTKKVAGDFENVRYLLENEHCNSPYSCRNRGIEVSKAEVIVLLDATCIPEPEWLEAGLDCLEAQKADMVSSNVQFDFRNKITAGKVYDSNNLKIESSIRKRGAVMTASLFVRRLVFDKVGVFPEGVRSGADIRWTGRATKQGMELVFCSKSIAKKRARSYLESIKKQWRVGKGQPAIWKELDKKYVNPYKRLISNLVPYHPREVKKLASGKGVDVSAYVKFKLYFVAYSVWIVMAMANIYGESLLKNKGSHLASEHK